MRYRPFQPIIDGERRWALRVTDGGKRRQILIHPETGKPFTSRGAVERLIEEIRGQKVSHAGVTVSEIGKHLFSREGPWAQRQARRRDGRELAEHTVAEHELNARLHILPALGTRTIAEIDTQAIDAFLYSLDMSNRGRRNVAGTLRTILKEAVYRRIIPAVPPIELPEKKSRKPSVLTLDELRLLFPKGRQALLDIWGGEKVRGKARERGLALSACSATMFFGGLRPQEARAVWPDQLLKKLNVLLVTRSMSGAGVVEYLKKGDAERDPRYRGTLLVDRAMEILEEWLRVRKKNDFLFTYMDRPIRSELLHARLQTSAKRAGIPLEGRRVIPYSGRFTFNTTVRPFLPPEVLMSLMGHQEESMSWHYDIPALVERMKQLAPYRKKLDKAIG